MSTARDFAKETGALCVGAVAFAMGDPSGGTLLATPLTALAALGLTLRSGCAEKACARAEAQILKLLAQNPEYTSQEIDRARAILKDAPSVARLDPKAVAAIAETDLETDLSEAILATLAIGADDGKVWDIVRIALVAGIACAKTDAEFRGALTLELVLETARKQGHEIAIAEDTNRIVKRVLKHVETESDAALREAANFFKEAPPESATRFELMTFLKSKAEDIDSLLKEREALPPALPRLANVRSRVTAAIEDLRLDEAEQLLDAAREVHKRDVVQAALEANAELDEQKAEILLVRGDLEKAYKVLEAVADSFATFDPLEPTRRRLRYEDRFYAHGLRYGGRGMALSEAMLRRATVDARPDPTLWANGMNALGIALTDQGSRIGGPTGARLLAEAVAVHRAALTVRSKADYPESWAKTQNNLGNALANQGTHTDEPDGTRLLAQAVAAYRAALTVRTKADHPEQWAMTQNNLGAALRNQGTRTGGPEGALLLGEAVNAYREALTIRTEEDHPLGWATTQNNLGIALRNQSTRIYGTEGARLLGEAVEAHRAALSVYTEANHPVDWAMTRENLALAEESIADQDTTADPRPHLEAALDHVEAALTVYNPEHMSYDHGTATALRDRLAARLAGLDG